MHQPHTDFSYAVIILIWTTAFYIATLAIKNINEVLRK